MPSTQCLFKLREVEIFLPSRLWQSHPSRSLQQLVSWNFHCGCPYSPWWCMLCGNKHKALPSQRAVESTPPTAATHFIPHLNQLPNYHLTTPTLVYTFAMAIKNLNSAWGQFWLDLNTNWELCMWCSSLSCKTNISFGTVEQKYSAKTSFHTHSSVSRPGTILDRELERKEIFCQVGLIGKVLGKASAG